jgi:hypothetical protein
MRSYTKSKFSIEIEAIKPDVYLESDLTNLRKKTDIVHEYILRNEK